MQHFSAFINANRQTTEKNINATILHLQIENVKSHKTYKSNKYAFTNAKCHTTQNISMQQC